MVLDAKLKKAICDFVYTKPRVIDEVAKHIGKNWRTADRYIQKISEEDGSISTRTFREGTRGALKIVFWSNIENIHSSSFQDRIFKKIESADHKDHFDPFDIYQYVDADKKRAFLEDYEENNKVTSQKLIPLLRSAENNLYVFSGNLSWINLIEKDLKLIKLLEELAERGVVIRVVCRVDFASLHNLEKVYAINEKLGKDMIRVRHCRQPLRGFIVDDKVLRFKEEKLVKDYKGCELKKNILLLMEIYDEEWVEWMKKVFFNLYRTSLDGKKRIEELNLI